jgi:hypothetical protein
MAGRLQHFLAAGHAPLVQNQFCSLFTLAPHHSDHVGKICFTPGRGISCRLQELLLGRACLQQRQ